MCQIESAGDAGAMDPHTQRIEMLDAASQDQIPEQLSADGVSGILGDGQLLAGEVAALDHAARRQGVNEHAFP